MYETDENKNIVKLRLQNTISNETLASPMHEENPNQLYPQNRMKRIGNELSL